MANTSFNAFHNIKIVTKISEFTVLSTLKFVASTHTNNRGSYRSTHVLLNLLNKVGKSDKMRGLSSIYLSQ